MRTQIIATIGPKSESPEMIEALVSGGMDIARMNFSHCTVDEYRKRRDLIALAAKKFGRKVRILQDLRGPRIRVGEMPVVGRKIVTGEKVVFSTSKDIKPNEVHIDDPYLHLDIKVNDPLYLSNGEMELKVLEKKDYTITAEVVRGGTLFSRKAVNVPNTVLSVTGPTDKDIADVKFAISEGVDLIAISFVQSAADVIRLKEIAGDKAKIIAKIETAIALNNIDEIIRAADAIMIARGDLGIEVPVEQLPYIQKNLIRHASWHGKPSITATQMLYSMVENDHPTRAEVSDVANAVWDGADAVMLSDETASGRHPLQSLLMMVKIVRQAEDYHYADETRL